jgi:SpoIID/LytB domain protein
VNRLSNSLRPLCDLCVSAVRLLVVSARSLFNSRRTQALTLLSASIITSLSGSAPPRLDPPAAFENEIDQALQQAATQALGQREGAIIVMNPQTGRVRAVVNPRVAFSEAVMPGSTIKPFTALAALRSGLIDPNSRTVCPGRFTGLSFSVACVHDNKLPPFTPAQAIAYSCNYYFGTLGERLGRDKLVDTLRGFGFGQPTGLSDERGKLLPCEAGNNAKVRSGEKAQADCNAREAIGESDHFTVTPIQLLAAYSALVNGGRLLAPRVASANEFNPIERERIDIAPQHRAILTEGMMGAVRYGTAKNAHLDSLSLSILGKTGTSLPAKGFRTNGWFVGFASAAAVSQTESEPAPLEVGLAVLIFLPRSHGSEAAVLAKPIFDAYAGETNGIHRRDAEERRGRAENSLSNSPIRNSQSAIKIHLVTENVTQELSLEDYVLGVMRAEGTMESEPEALKALAIAIRTYALKNHGRHAKDGYDFCTTTHCQRFVTGNSSPAMIDAVRATEGQVLTDDRGQPVDAYFGASCGGETANIAALWGTRPSQYLAGVRDEYCASGPHATWTDVIARADLLRALQSDARTNVGARLDQIVVSKRDETGRAEFITIEGEHRKQVRGWDFKIIVGRVLGWNVLKSSRFEVGRAGSNFVFRGSGFGHGLGLCQEGAHVMAARGSSYQRILEKYFPGAHVGRDRIAALPPHSAERLCLSGPPLSTFMTRGEAKPRLKALRGAQREAIGFPHWGGGKAAAFSGWNADLLPNVPKKALSFSPAGVRSKTVSLSSEHFRVTYPPDVDRRDANLVLNTLESARSDFLHRASASSFSPEIQLLEIRINATTGDFTGRTGQPWWAAAATKGNRIELQPVGVLKLRGSLTTTLRHELAHVVIDAVSHNRAPRWLGEGFAIYLAGEGPMFARYATKTKLSPDQIEKRLERPGSQQEMRMLYSLAYNQVSYLIQSGSEASVWKKLAAN